MVHAALFISPNSSCETARIFECDCMYISMSYHYCKYEFLGPESDLERCAPKVLVWSYYSYK